jgi:hypothetical protein
VNTDKRSTPSTLRGSDKMSHNEEDLLATIEEQYPDRLLQRLNLDDTSFTATFELPKERHLRLWMSAHEESSGEITVYETVQETGEGRYLRSQGNHYSIPGVESAIPSLLSRYLQIAVGDSEEHTYENSFVGLILKKVEAK